MSTQPDRPVPTQVVELPTDYHPPMGGQPHRVRVAPGLVVNTIHKRDLEWAMSEELHVVKAGDRLPNGSPIILNEGELTRDGEFVSLLGDLIVVETIAHHEQRQAKLLQRLKEKQEGFTSAALQGEIAAKAQGVPARVLRFEQTMVADEEAAAQQRQMKADQAKPNRGGD